MNGMKGIVVALSLGVVGALCNYAYLMGRTQNLEMVHFIGVKPETTVNRGDRLQEAQLQRVSIARANAGNLVQFAEPFESLGAVVGCRVYRTLEGGSLLLRTDTKTPPAELVFNEQTRSGVEEVAIGVPIDPARIVPALIQPGDTVSFIAGKGIGPGVFPTPASGTPNPPASGSPDSAVATGGDGEIERIGPFRVLSLGTRLGSTDVARAARQNTVQENVMMVAVLIENGKFESKALQLLELVERGATRPLGYVLHARVLRRT
jgi:hypothetical protein